MPKIQKFVLFLAVNVLLYGLLTDIFVKDRVDKEEFVIGFFPTESMIAEYVTKPPQE